MDKTGIKEKLILVGLLFEFAFTMLGGALFGYFLDEWFHTKPYLTVIFLIGAALASIKIFMIIYARAKKSMESNDD